MAENEPIVIIVDGQPVTYYDKHQNAPVLNSGRQAATILTLATTQPEYPPSSQHLGQLFIDSGVTLQQAGELKSYLTFAEIKQHKHPEVVEQIHQATIVLSSAIGFMSTQNLPARPEPSVYPSTADHGATLHLPDHARKQGE